MQEVDAWSGDVNVEYKVRYFESGIHSKLWPPLRLRVESGRTLTISPSDLERAIAGDLTVMPHLANATHSDLTNAWEASSKPVVRASAVVGIVESLLEGALDPVDAQYWAALMMHGYLERYGQPIRPIEFSYEAGFEEEITEVVFELEQLGDLVDGEVDPPKLEALIAPMKQSP